MVIVKSIMIVIGKSISLMSALMETSMLKKLEVRLPAFKREQGAGPLNPAMATNTLPFTKDILEFKIPKDFKQPKMRLYEKTTAPMDFLNDFGY
ncbi:unnamed protein product [Prunus armeniaca]|uniref:Uncharacterized protein n=1 Tax=Prunus armeniaca TaxID=36596 RepID=A0A6J5Y464_PRUAR|nr:unnamed protein product [Prunus armeniaca]CAB4320201.1 unnamed protein product [Prunus armeniaca]